LKGRGFSPALPDPRKTPGFSRWESEIWAKGIFEIRAETQSHRERIEPALFYSVPLCLSGRFAVIRPLPRSFFGRDPRRVARDLLGKVLVRQEPAGRARAPQPADQRLTGRIVEVEAYLGEKDPAAHAFSGRTLRNAVLFGPPGHAYVYFIYGNHYCLNVSCEPEGHAGCVLFRALEPLTGIEEMAEARGIRIEAAHHLRLLTSGPGRLAQAFSITRERDNGCDLSSSNGSLWIGDDGYGARKIRLTARIGISKAADKNLRYFLEGSPFVSGPRALPPPRKSSAMRQKWV
jgi:DNA-3-methyladenine glycosylase